MAEVFFFFAAIGAASAPGAPGGSIALDPAIARVLPLATEDGRQAVAATPRASHLGRLWRLR